MARIEVHYGEQPTRLGLASIGFNLGAAMDGDWMEWRTDDVGSALSLEGSFIFV